MIPQFNSNIKYITEVLEEKERGGFLPSQSNQIFFLADSTGSGVRYVDRYAPDFPQQRTLTALADPTVGGGGTAIDTRRIFFGGLDR